MGIQLIQLPYNLLVHQKNFTPSSKGKITADKSWRVVTRLLKEKATSIRQISVKEGISYGLSHKVIQELLDSHIASKDDYLIRISDISPLLNIIAWERNLKKLKIDEISQPLISNYLATAEIPDPEILIRTGGEYRISNFLLWQIAYTELFFSKKMWPDFRKKDLKTIIEKYQLRESRFGKTSEQLSQS